MHGQDKFNKFVDRYPHSHKFFFDRPYCSRRTFFQVLGAGITGSHLANRLVASDLITQSPVTMQNRAKNVIFVLLSGAPSHIDTFDFKMMDGVTPASFAPAKINGIGWPAGLMPLLADKLQDMVIVRAMTSWALQHNLARTWAQIGRNPAGALGPISPNIGSIIALEKDKERLPSATFPTFLALNSNDAIGSGYLAANYAPVKFAPSQSGFPDTNNADGQTRFNTKWDLLYTLDSSLRVNSPNGRAMEDYDNFYKAARGMMFNPDVDRAFRYSAADSERFGNSGFGNACLVASRVLAANQGTRYIQITLGSWDHHQNIYQAANLPRMATMLDAGLSTLMNDLKANGLLKETLIVLMGEFGRTVGPLTAQGGRDHFLQQFVAFAGAGVKGGRALGATDDRGSLTTEFAWSRDRDVKPEDVEATILSAIGINWTTVRYDDPFNRGFEYVPYAQDDIYGPINELWAS